MLYTPSQSLDGLQYSVTSLDVEPLRLSLTGHHRRGGPHGASTLRCRGATNRCGLWPGGSSKARPGPVRRRASWRTISGPRPLHVQPDPPPAPGGENAVKYFLKTSKTGYCQQFAFAMAVLARLLGIPSRVVVGYTAGTRPARGPRRPERETTWSRPAMRTPGPSCTSRGWAGCGWSRRRPVAGSARARRSRPPTPPGGPARRAEAQPMAAPRHRSTVGGRVSSRSTAGRSATKAGFAEGGPGAAGAGRRGTAARPCCSSRWPRCW